jgi:hypothetical protein
MKKNLRKFQTFNPGCHCYLSERFQPLFLRFHSLSGDHTKKINLIKKREITQKKFENHCGLHKKFALMNLFRKYKQFKDNSCYFRNVF